MEIVLWYEGDVIRIEFEIMGFVFWFDDFD